MRSYFYTFLCAVMFFAFQTSFAKSAAWSGDTALAFSSGKGTSDNPYLISTPEELVLMTTMATKQLYFKLADDIVFNEGQSSSWAITPPEHQWHSVGDSANAAHVNIDGNGHFISGIYINSDRNYQGLFGVFCDTIKNLTLKNSFIRGNDFVGAVAGALIGAGSIRSVKVDAYVNGKDVIGGAVGSAGSRILFTSIPGGIMDFVGFNSLLDVSVSGMVSGNDYVGGISGFMLASYSSGKIIGCENSAEITGVTAVGGLIGYAFLDVPTDSIYVSFGRNKGNITGTRLVGGIAGYVLMDRIDENPLVIKNVYNVGSVTGSAIVGGVLGSALLKRQKEVFVLENAYNGGAIVAVDSVGAICGKCNVGVSFFNSLNVFDLNEDKKDSIVAYSDSLGCNFMPDTGSVKQNGGYPLLIYFDPEKVFNRGTGTESDPFLIGSLSDLHRFEKHVSMTLGDKGRYTFYRQTADIELPADIDNNWIPPEVNGIFYNGGFHSISNLNIKDTTLDSAGFFRKVTFSCIKNLSMKNAKVNARNEIGILAGNAGDTWIENIKVDGTVIGARFVGGVFGGANAFLYNVENKADVSGDDGVGGIAGETGVSYFYMVKNQGAIKGKKNAGGLAGYAQNQDTYFSYNRGPVSGGKFVGGLFGFFRNGMTSHSYNASTVVSVEDSAGSVFGLAWRSVTTDSLSLENVYFDNTLSSLPLIGGGKDMVRLSLVSVLGLSTNAMRGPALLDSLGYAFVEDENGGYPALNEFKGSGTEASPYLIGTSGDLWLLSVVENKIRYNRYQYYCSNLDVCEGDYFKMTDDIEMKTDSVHPWIPIDAEYNHLGFHGCFSGVFDGGLHSVSGLYADTMYAGLFGCNAGIVKNIGVENSTIKGKYAGAIAGINVNAIERSWNKGSYIQGSEYAGGIVGINQYPILNRSKIELNLTYINQTYNQGTVAGKCAGGIAGSLMNGDYWSIPKNTVAVANSYNRGKIAALDSSTCIGGIIGELPSKNSLRDSQKKNFVQVRNTYNTENVCSSSKASYCGQIFGFVHSPALLVNNYYLGDDDKKPNAFGSVEYLGQYDSTGLFKTKIEMKSTAFAALLGNAYAYDSGKLNDGYPLFSSKPGTIAGINAQNTTSYFVYRPLNVRVSGWEIFVDDLARGAEVALFDMNGRRIWAGFSDRSSLVIPVNKTGVYLVKSRNQTASVRVSGRF